MARFLHLNCPTALAAAVSCHRWRVSRPWRRFQSWERVETTRENGVENKMYTETMPKTRAMKAVRLGLIVASWAFLVLGFVLTHNV